MARFVKLTYADTTDTWGLPQDTGEAIVNTDHIVSIESSIWDASYQSHLNPAIVTGMYPCLHIALVDGSTHTISLGRHDTWTDAQIDLDRLIQQLTRTCTTRRRPSTNSTRHR